MQTPSDTTAAQWSNIVALLRTEATSGRLKNVNWANSQSTTKTSTLADVRRSLHLWTQQPAGTASSGVELSKYELNQYGTGRRWLVSEFAIIVSVEAVGYTDTHGNEVPPNADDALAQAYAFVSDGQGNGIAEIFKDPNNYTLSGAAQVTRITSVQTVVRVEPGETPQIWGGFLLTLRCEKPVSIS